MTDLTRTPWGSGGAVGLLARYRIHVGSLLRAGAVRMGYYSRPAFIILGGQKCGTSALSAYLSMHPDIRPACKKEIHFFDKDLAYSRGSAWYHSHFPLPHKIERGAITFEATPSYLYRAKSARRIHEYDANLKLIVVLRDPVERAYSHWNMYRILLTDDRGLLLQASRDSDVPVRQWVDKILTGESFHRFEEAICEELEIIAAESSTPEPSYIRRGLYHEQMTRYLGYFDRERIMVVDSRSLMRRRRSTLDRVIEFLQLPSHDWSSQELPLVHARPYRGEMPEHTRDLLVEFYRPHNELLYELLGHDFGWDQGVDGEAIPNRYHKVETHRLRQ